MIQIDLRELKDGGTLELHEKIDGKKEDLEFWDLSYSAPLSYDGTVERTQKTLFVRGIIGGTAQWTCSRCLKKIEQPVRERVDFTVQIRNETTVDILEGLREILVLSHPVRFLCQPDCKGLCAQCGANLNTQSCTCRCADEQTPFANLNELLKNKNKKKGQ